MPGGMEEDEVAIAHWLAQGGYPLEMWAAREMRRSGMIVNQSTYYLDPVKNTHRELDIEARLETSFSISGQPAGMIRFRVIVECKRSTEPWIAFTEFDHSRVIFRDLQLPTTLLGLHLIADCEKRGLPIRALRADTDAYALVRRREKSPARDKEVDSEEKGDLAFAATKKLAAAAAEALGEEMSYNDVRFVYPLLLVDAPLYVASLGKDNDPEVTRTDSTILHSPPSITGRRVSILVLTKRAFGPAVREIAREIELLRTAADERLGELSQSLAAALSKDSGR